MNKLLLIIITFCSLYAKATHIVGGELIYQHLGGSSYYLTIKLYKDCNPGTQNFPSDLEVEAFTGFGLDTIGTLPADDFFILPRLGRDTLAPNVDTCAFNPGVCVEEAIYGAIVSLPPVEGGYHLFYQTYARNGSLLNIVDPLQAGESFYAYVPDNSLYLTNSSPVFSNSPPVFVCKGYDLNLDFSATDVDGDSLVYSFYTPYTGRSWDHPDHYDPTLYYPTIDLGGTPPDNITFPEVVYNPGFSADNPLNAFGGAALTISSEGIINGVPEAVGQYVVGVMVEEYRDGVKIGEIVRDFQFNVLNCPPPYNAVIGEIDGCTDYEITFTNESGEGATGFWWNFGTGIPSDTSNLEEPTFDFTPFAPGTFEVTLIAQKGTNCADTTTMDLILSGVEAGFSIPDTVCLGEPIFFEDTSNSQVNGVLETWSWDFGDGSSSDLQFPTYSYGSPGDFVVSLEVGSDVGCTDVISKPIHVKDISGAGIAPMMGCIGLEVDFTNSSVAEAENFHWNFGTGFPSDTSNLENPSFTYSDYGVYDVMLITEPGTFCSDTAIYELLVSTVNADFEVPDTTCSDILIDFEDLSTTINGDIFSWEWDFGDGSTSTDSDPAYGYTSPGTFTITLVVISDIGCTDTVSKEITIFDAPVAAIGYADYCSGLTIDFNNISPVDAGGFWWDFGTGDDSDTSVLANPTFTYDAFGTYTVTLIAQKGTACETTSNVDIVVSDLDIAFDMPDTACINTEINFTDLSVTAPGTELTEWEWDFGDLVTSDEQNPTHSYGSSGDLAVKLVVHSDIGCSDTLVKPLYIQPQPIAFAGLDTAVCISEPSLELDGSITGAEGGIWSGDGGTFLPSVTDLEATYFPTIEEIDLGFTNIVLTTEGNGFCEAGVDTLRLVYLGDPNVNAGDDIDVCIDSSYVIVNASVEFESDVIWSTAGDGSFDDEGSLSTIYTFGPDDISAGGVVLYIDTYNYSGCPEDSDTLQININEPPTMEYMNDTLICSGFPIFLDPNTSTGNGAWSSSGDGIFDPDTGATTIYTHGSLDSLTGSFTIYFTTLDNGGCDALFDSLLVDIIPSPEPDFNFTEVCFGEETAFTNTSESDDPIVAYEWNFELGENSDLENPTHTFNQPGTHPVEFIVFSENGCSDTIVKEVRSHFIPETNFSVPAPCLNGGTYFADSTHVDSASLVSWHWDFGDGKGTDTVQNPTYQYAIEGVYDIRLTTSSEFGCTKDTTITVLINLGPIASISANPPSAHPFVTINFKDETVENGGDLVDWQWDFADGNFSTEQNPLHTYDDEDEYNVVMIVEDENGCIDTAELILPIYHGPLVPNAFSPNGDLNNDYLMVLGGNFEELNFTVYNNWGEVVFETNDIESQGWDGTFKGEPQPLGVYVYVVKVKTFDGEEHSLSGDVSLIR
ncbi:PKD domain-containing protein [Crocinitomix algicola]|uniref:PKD domain-containing protein n=1 Tax=Crocinitomix algicola TaxID=1740263 RepID=UPI000829CC34|nr:PKD domain-containing protein [Crocinitomix algicola]